ncbi:hypothetical protein AC249_AIPGENE16794 [Paramuricea clavata]|uniref:Uncharacterized protein n=1 Tax=Paramuricea clavata TaxID=317549 RepID=A0A7D9DJZ7_PARCT|nr:hypothetical protein AC249_AIPGENE16794 [Paramuricea clavata]
MSNINETPKKLVPTAKHKKLNSNDYCRCCKLSLRVQYGDSWKSVSTENVFNASKKKGFEGQILAQNVDAIGIKVERKSDLSERLCKPCATKIRNACAGFLFLLHNINTINPIFMRDQEVETTATGVHDTINTSRTKRTLPTTVSTPERSPISKKTQKTGTIRLKRSLGKQFDNTINKDHNEDSLLNIDDIICHDDEEKVQKQTRVKVLILWPNGRTDVKVPSSDENDTIRLVKNIVLNNWKAVSHIVLTHRELKPEILKAVRSATNNEFKQYCNSDTILKRRSTEELIAFSNSTIIKEITERCPLWSSCVSGACSVQLQQMHEYDNTNAINSVALATSAIARVRNKSMSALTYRVSSILFHSGVSYQDMTRLNRLGIGMSPDMVISFQRQLGKNFDSKVLSYKSSLEEKPHDTLALMMEIKDKQPVTNDDIVAIDVCEEKLSSYQHFTPESFTRITDMLQSEKEKKNVDIISNEVLDQVITDHKKFNFPFFKLVGDNIDHEINARIQTKEHGNQSIHWTHQTVIRDSVVDPCLDNTKPRQSLDQLQLLDILPTATIQSRLKHSWAILVSRVVTKHLKYFAFLRNVVINHIPHQYSKEASTKSEICCLGMEFYNPNIAGEMAQLLIKNQNKYVPSCGKGESKKVITPIPFHGDQLFEERARNVIWTFQDGDNEFDSIKGLNPEFADWHGKVNLYEMEFNMFCKSDSGNELGTTKASMNRTRKTNASAGPGKKYNEYKEFHQCELEAHICSAFMEMTGMEDTNGTPKTINLPSNLTNKQTKGEWLLSLCESFIDRYCFDSEDLDNLIQQTNQLELASLGKYKCRVEKCDKAFVYHSGRVSHEISAHQMNNDRNGQIRDEYGYYFCRADCGHVFSTKATRNRHEKKNHLQFTPEEDTSVNDTPDPIINDHLYNYHCAKLKFGMILFDFNDAVQEGDGQRLHDIYKLALLLYKSGGHTKYSYVVLLYLVKIAAIYSEFEAHNLMWNRFYNKYGRLGGNISLDLKKEQQNKVLKTIWRALGSNLNKASASRVAEALENLERLI